MKDQFEKRFSELDESYKTIPFRTSGGVSGRYVANGAWYKWATSAQNLILAVFGQKSPHYTNFERIHQKCNGRESCVNALNAIFQSAKEDFEGGYVFDVVLRVSGEVFGDFVILARQSLSEGHKDVAAVLACAALEDALKKYASSQDINVSEKTMGEVINALKAEGLVSGPQKSLLDTMPRIRNMAMHAEWAKISAPDVSSVIGFVEQFLLSKFSSG